MGAKEDHGKKRPTLEVASQSVTSSPNLFNLLKKNIPFYVKKYNKTTPKITMLIFIPRNNSPLGSFPTKFTNPAGPGFPFFIQQSPNPPFNQPFIFWYIYTCQILQSTL